MKNHNLALMALFLMFLSKNLAAELDPLERNPASPWYLSKAASGWYFDVGVGLEYEAGYPGSDVYSAEPDLFARAIYQTEAGHRLFFSLGEIGGIYALSEKTQLVAFLEYEEERDADDDEALVGLDVIDSTIEGQFAVAHRLNNFSFFGVVQPDLTGDANKGIVWFIGAGYDSFLENPNWRIATRIDISGADQEYMQTEFGISAKEALRTSYTAYAPSSGLKSATLNLSFEYMFNPKLSILTSIDTEYYFNEAANSPLIADVGSEVGYEASILMRWQF